jgi:sugar/nucleoside kinase (ribokinase family)
MEFDLVSLGLVCADVMVRPVDDLPERGTLALVPELDMNLGGLAGVTASVFARLGGSVAFISKLGNDGFGEYLASAVRQHGVNVDHVVRTDKCTSPATVVVINDAGERTFLHNPGTVTHLTEDDVDFDLVSKAKVLHWGGPGVTPGLDGEPIGRVFERAQSLGVFTTFDTCYDGAGVWLPRIEPALPFTNLVFSSITEARGYTGKDAPEEIASFYRSYGPAVAVIKLGPDGVYVQSDEGELTLHAQKVKTVVDTTGAGDAACGGYLYGHVQGWDIERCARLANAVGGLTVQCMGGAGGVQSLEATLAFMEGADHG